MANEIRLRPNFVAGGLSADLASGATSMSSAGLADMPVVDTTNHCAVTLWRTDAAGRVILKEIVWVTAHTASATTATIVRAREGTTAQNWLTGDRWSVTDLSSDNTVICTSSTRPTNPYNGQQIWETDTQLLLMYNGSQWRRVEPERFGWARFSGVGNTTSSSFSNMPGTPSFNAIKRQTAGTSFCVEILGSAYVNTNGTPCELGVETAGTYFGVAFFFFNTAGQHSVVSGMNVGFADWGAGTYGFRVVYRSPSGLSVNVDSNDVIQCKISEVANTP